jgi:hypothetical protein
LPDVRIVRSSLASRPSRSATGLLDQRVDLALQRGIAALGEHVGGRLDDPRLSNRPVSSYFWSTC